MNESIIENAQHQFINVITGGEKGITPGSFKKALFEAILRADSDNRARLAVGFSLEVAIVNAYNTGANIDEFPIIKSFAMGNQED